MLRGTELQFMYAEVLRALLAVALGGNIELELLRPKIVRLVRKTIKVLHSPTNTRDLRTLAAQSFALTPYKNDNSD